MIPFEANHKAMRAVRRDALQRGSIAVLDIGSSQFACLVLQFEPGAAPPDTMTGAHGFSVIGAATTRARGIRFGTINSMAETQSAIRTVIKAAQEKAHRRIDHVALTFSGGLPRSYGVAGEVDISAPTIAHTDIGRVLGACTLPDYGQSRTVVHAHPVNFTLDGRGGFNDPRGHMAKRLGIDVHMITCTKRTIYALKECLKSCDLHVAGLAVSPYVSGLSTLVEDELELGAACIDLGSDTTGVSVFFRKHMVYADVVEMGGRRVTQDISKGLHISPAQAERIKTVYGGTIATGVDDRDIITFGGDVDGWDNTPRQISRAELITLMRPRLEEILEAVHTTLTAAGFDGLTSQQVVLTGGGAHTPGIDALAGHILQKNVRLGRPVRLKGLPQPATGPEFASVVGAALFANQPQDEWWDFDVPQSTKAQHALRRTMAWFRSNW